MKKFFKEFGQFIAKGNILDLAVALVIGTAFNAIVKSLVNDIIMPLIGRLIKTNVTELKWVLAKEVLSEDGTEVIKTAITVNYGSFIQSIIDFLVIAFSIFLILKVVISIRKRATEAQTSLKKKISKKKGIAEEETVIEEPVTEEVVEETPVNNVEVLLGDIKEILASMKEKE